MLREVELVELLLLSTALMDQEWVRPQAEMETEVSVLERLS